MMPPIAKQDRLVTQELGDELLIYDLARHRAHSLNRAAALVWRACDGKRTTTELAARLHEELGAPRDERLAESALEQLARAHLITFPEPRAASTAPISRRELARQLGRAAAAVPVVLSITAPRAASAATVACKHGGASCTKNANCCSANCSATFKTCVGG